MRVEIAGGAEGQNLSPPERVVILRSRSRCLNPRPAGVFSRTRPAGGGQVLPPPLPNSRTNRRSEADEAAIESPEREDSNAH